MGWLNSMKWDLWSSSRSEKNTSHNVFRTCVLSPKVTVEHLLQQRHNKSSSIIKYQQVSLGAHLALYMQKPLKARQLPQLPQRPSFGPHHLTQPVLPLREGHDETNRPECMELHHKCGRLKSSGFAKADPQDYRTRGISICWSIKTTRWIVEILDFSLYSTAAFHF